MTDTENHVEITGVIDDLKVNGIAQTAVGLLPFSFGLSANISVRNVRQEGPFIKGEVRAEINAGIGSVSGTWPFSVNTGLANPYKINLGTISVPLLGTVPVDGSFGWDLPNRKLKLKIYVAGIEVASKTVSF